jgi:hypothetical protein
VALSATYNADLSRYVLAATALGASATYAVFDRTVDSINYTTVRGGGFVTVTSQLAGLSDYEYPAGVPVTYRVRSYNGSNVLQQTFTTSVTPQVTDVWIKVPARPYLNRAVTVTGVGDVSRPARNGVFPVIGRSFPVGVADVRQSRQFSLEVMTDNAADTAEFDLLLMSGEPIFLQVPPAFPVPSLYAMVGDTSVSEPARGDLTRLWSLPLTEVAAPAADVVGSLGTYQTVKSTYATYADVLAAKTTYAQLLEMIGSPTEVVVP